MVSLLLDVEKLFQRLNTATLKSWNYCTLDAIEQRSSWIMIRKWLNWKRSHSLDTSFRLLVKVWKQMIQKPRLLLICLAQQTFLVWKDFVLLSSSGQNSCPVYNSRTTQDSYTIRHTMARIKILEKAFTDVKKQPSLLCSYLF